MNICLYTASALPKIGGQELVVDALARHFIALGHQVTVLAPYPRKLTTDDTRFPYQMVRHRRLISTRYFVAFFRRYLLAAHRKHRFDIVHCHDVYPTGYLAALAREHLGIPVVITSHGGDVRVDNPRLAKPGLRQRFIFALESADALVSIGSFTDDGIHHLTTKPRRVEHIPNGVDTALLQAAAPRPPDLPAVISDQPYLLFLGRLHRRKGVDTLLHAISRLSPSQRMPLLIAGDGDERLPLQSLAAELKIAETVHFCGRVEGQSKTWLLQHADGVVIPSRGWEAFPLVVLEAYTAGKPVIASRIPGLRDLVKSETTGLLFDEDNAEQLANHLARVRQDASWRSATAQRCRDFARDYDWDTIAQRHIALYADLIATAG